MSTEALDGDEVWAITRAPREGSIVVSRLDRLLAGARVLCHSGDIEGAAARLEDAGLAVAEHVWDESAYVWVRLTPGASVHHAIVQQVALLPR